MRRNRSRIEKNMSILAVDDDAIMTATLQAYFQRSGYEVDVENDPCRAVERVREGNYDILLLDFLMSPICGDQVVEEIRSFDRELYIILLTGHKSMAPPIKTIRELEIQGYYEKSDRFDQLELLVESCVKSIRQNRMIKQYNQELTEAYRKLNDSYIEIIEALRTIVDERDIYTRGHSERVSVLAAALAARMKQGEQFIERVRVAGMFHDIGKVGISDRLLLKSGRLTEEEYENIKMHSVKGAKILEAITMFAEIVPIVRYHHEKIDGSGYPEGLRGEEIPLESRIIAVADSFDAMTSHRHYCTNIPLEQAVEELKSGENSQFDAQVVAAFLELYAEQGAEQFWAVYGMKEEE